jgi:hypothetical protein
MKAAVVGTQYLSQTEPVAILREAGIRGFRRMAGYVPPTMPVDDSVFSLLPVADIFINIADDVLHSLHAEKVIKDCNPRASYLVLARLLDWLDRKYLTTYHAPYPVMRYAKLLLIGIAAGYYIPLTFSRPRFAEITDKRSIWTKYASIATMKIIELIYQQDILSGLNTPPEFYYVSPTIRSMNVADLVASALGGWTTRAKIQKIALQWAYMSDEQALEIIQSMLWTMLETSPVNSKASR